MTADEIAALRQIAERAAKIAPGNWDTDTVDNEDGKSHFASYCVFIAGEPGEVGKGIVDTLNSDVIAIEVDCDVDGCTAWDENGRIVTAYIATFDPPAVTALLDEIAALRAENERLRLELMAIYLADRNFIDSSNVIDGTITTGFHVGDKAQVLGLYAKIAGRAIGEVK